MISRLYDRLTLGPHAGANLADWSPLIAEGATDPAWRRVQEVFQQQATLPDYINLDDAVKRLAGFLQPIFDQRWAGVCTVSAWSEARRLSRANECVRTRPFGQWTRPSVEWLYGMARTRLVNPNNAAPGSSLGDVALIARAQGVLEAAKYPTADLTYYNPATAQKWEKTGPPSTLLPYAFRKVETLLAFTEAEVQTALFHGLAVAFQARWYFTATDKNGLIIGTSINPPQGHAMVIQGILKDSRGEFYCIRNNMGSKVFSGGQDPRFPMRGTGLLPADQARATIFNSGAMFVPMGA